MATDAAADVLDAAAHLNGVFRTDLADVLADTLSMVRLAGVGVGGGRGGLQARMLSEQASNSANRTKKSQNTARDTLSVDPSGQPTTAPAITRASEELSLSFYVYSPIAGPFAQSASASLAGPSTRRRIPGPSPGPGDAPPRLPRRRFATVMVV